jgi:hypothetical protein
VTATVSDSNSYTVTIFSGDDASDAQKVQAAERFCAALEAQLGDASLVAPMYVMYQRLVNTFGETPDVEVMNDAEREVFESWQLAESAAMQAAFGTHRYLDEGGYQLRIL